MSHGTWLDKAPPPITACNVGVRRLHAPWQRSITLRKSRNFYAMCLIVSYKTARKVTSERRVIERLVFRIPQDDVTTVLTFNRGEVRINFTVANHRICERDRACAVRRVECGCGGKIRRGTG